MTAWAVGHTDRVPAATASATMRSAGRTHVPTTHRDRQVATITSSGPTLEMLMLSAPDRGLRTAASAADGSTTDNSSTPV